MVSGTEEMEAKSVHMNYDQIQFNSKMSASVLLVHAVSCDGSNGRNSKRTALLLPLIELT
jgi:hypothetical protein